MEIEQYKKLFLKASESSQQTLPTVSPLPNTTLEFLEFKFKTLGIRVFDTPGIPNPKQIYNYFESQTDAKLLVVTKKISPISVKLEAGLCLFLGGLVRIDMVSGFPLNAIFFGSQNVSLHVTKIEKGNEVFIKNYGKILKPVLRENFQDVKFRSRRIRLNLKGQKGISSEDLEIMGLGWMSFVD